MATFTTYDKTAGNLRRSVESDHANLTGRYPRIFCREKDRC